MTSIPSFRQGTNSHGGVGAFQRDTRPPTRSMLDTRPTTSSSIGQGSLYPTVQSTLSGSTLPTPSGMSLQTPATSPHKVGDVGTVRVSDLKKQIKPLELASGFIDSYLEKDKNYPELDRIIMQGQSSEYLFAESPSGLGPLMPFRKAEFVNIPDEIFDQYNQTQCFTRMGIFPSIDRAWITVDNRLYFWNYRNGSDFLSFEELAHTILSVSLIKPKPDVFVESVNYLLVLCTPVELYILAVSHDKKSNDIQLYDTGMSVSVKGLDVSNIVASESTGRIFFGGSADGTNIWEVVYSNVESWFRGKCSKTCHTRSGIVSALTPNLPIPTSSGQLKDIPVIGALISEDSETIVSMKIDDSRSLLYTLSSKSVIRVYHMGKKDDLTLTMTYTINQILSHLQMITASSASGTISQSRNSELIGKTMSIVSIQVVKKYESSQIHLIAITSAGCRLYIRAVRSFAFGFSSNENSPPTTMQVIQIRFPPGVNNTPAHKSMILKTSKTPSSIFEPGYFFCAVGSVESLGDKLFVSTLDSGRVLHQLSTASAATAPVCIENACFLDIDGFVQAVELITPSLKASNVPEGFGNESAAQFSSKPPQIAVLTNTGVHVFKRSMPWEIFESFGTDVRTYFDLYGRTETCSNALCVASRISVTDTETRELATRVYIEGGGKPYLRMDDENVYSSTSGIMSAKKDDSTMARSPFAITSQTSKPNEDVVRLSGRFDGLATYVSRIIRNIWTSKVFEVNKIETILTTSRPRLLFGSGVSNNEIKEVKEVFKLSVDKSALESIQLSLFEVSEFLDKNRAFIEGLSGAPDGLLGNATRVEEIAVQAEHRGLDSIVRLIKSIREGIAFLLLLIEETSTSKDGIEAIMTFLPKEVRVKMSTLEFKRFFTTSEGTELAKELISGLINRSINEGGSVDSIARLLQDRCETYCSSGDVIIYKALEFLRKAKSLDEEYNKAKANSGIKNPASIASLLDFKMQNLYESVQMFQKAAHDINYETLKDSFKEFTELNYYGGAIEIALTVAKEFDRGNLALAYLHDSKPQGDSRAGLYESRLNIYKLIFDALDEIDAKAEAEISHSDASANDSRPLAQVRDESYRICFNCEDEVFHYSFYDWFFSKGLESRLLDIQTPYILSYLETNAKSNLGIADLLWVYSKKHGDFLTAAQVLFNLAKGDFELSLSQRLEFLSRARGYCNCDCPPNLRQQMVSLGNSIQEYLDIASIQDDILNAVKKDNRFTDGKKFEAIKTLDGKILPISDLFNDFADPLEYYEICLVIYQVTDFRGYEEVTRTWSKLIQAAYSEEAAGEEEMANGYERVSSTVQRLGQHIMLSEFVFPADFLIPTLESYALEHTTNAPAGWVIDTFLNAGMAHEAVYIILNDMYERKEFPFDERPALKRLSMDIMYLLDKWVNESRGRVVSSFITKSEIEKFGQFWGQRETATVIQKLKL